MGLDVILALQKASNPTLDWFFMLVTITIDPITVFVGVIVMVVFSHRKGKGFIMLVFILFNIFWAAFLKSFHCDPRPFWSLYSIKNIGIYCPVEYGNPSGHSWFSVLIGFGVIMEYRGLGRKYQNLIISFLLVILVPISRMYLGAHSLNQVLEGLVLGACSSLLFRLGLKDMLHRFLVEFNHKKIWKVMIISLHILILIPFLMHMDEELPEKQLENIHEKCLKSINEPRLNQLMLVLNALMVNVLTGVAMGYEQLVKSPIGAFYLSGRWRIDSKYGKKLSKVLFFLVETGFLLSGLLVAAVCFKLVPHFLVAYAGVSVGGIVSGYVYTTKTAAFLNKHGIIKKHVIDEKNIVENGKKKNWYNLLLSLISILMYILSSVGSNQSWSFDDIFSGKEVF